MPARGDGWGVERWTVLAIACAILLLLGEALVRALREE